MIISFKKSYTTEELFNSCSHAGSSAHTFVKFVVGGAKVECFECRYHIKTFISNSSKIWSATLFHLTSQQISVYFDGMLYSGGAFHKRILSADYVENLIDLENYKDKFSKLLLLL